VCKKPVIGASIGAVRDVINENVDGLIMQVDNIDSLKKNLSLLIEDESLRNRLGQKGYEKVIENYTWNIITARLRNYYKETTQSISKQNLKITADV
jgi:glycosyltransferase involved in cell wall biosynthesis